MACDLHRCASRDPEIPHYPTFCIVQEPFSDEACQAYLVIFPSVERAFFRDIFGLPVVTRYSVCVYKEGGRIRSETKKSHRLLKMLDTSAILQIRQVVDGHTRVSPYGYTPSAAANIAFLAIFSYSPYLTKLLTVVFSQFCMLEWESNSVHGISVLSSVSAE